MIPEKIIKDANVLRTRLQRGVINVHELEHFLATVADYNPQPAGRPKQKDRFLAQLENLDRGIARKPKRSIP